MADDRSSGLAHRATEVNRRHRRHPRHLHRRGDGLFAGHVLLAESRRILSQAEAAVIATQRTAQGRTGKLSVGFTVPWSYELVPAVLSAFATRNPGVALAIRELSSSEQVRLLVVRLVETGLGISLVPRWTRSHFSSRAVYVPLATQSHRARVTLALAWSKSNASPIVRHFCEAVRDVNEAGQRAGRRAG